MSYEYQITSNSCATEIYMKIKLLIENSTEYILISSTEGSSIFKNKTSESNWGFDIDLSLSNEVVFLIIHSGNVKKLLKFIDTSLFKSNLIIEEL